MDAILESNSSLKPAMSLQNLQYLTFTLGSEEYGVDIMTVREIKSVTDIKHLPSSPACMKGVTNLRGQIIPIFDLRARFDMPTLDASENFVVIILSALDKVIGIAVDAVSDILNCQSSELKPPPAMQQAARDVFINGLISLENRMVVVLDADHLFDQVLVEKTYH